MTFPRSCVDCGRDFLSGKRFDVLCPHCLSREVGQIAASLEPVEYEQHEMDMAVERRGYQSDRAVGPESVPQPRLLSGQKAR